MTSELFDAARTWLENGFNLIPIRADGTKRPIFEWKRFMSDRTTSVMVKFWLDRNPGAGLGIVCGAVSGNLEMLELEGRAHTSEGLAKIQAEVSKHPAAATAWDTITQGLVVESPSGGVHFFYRIGDNTVPGNEKIAQRPATDEELEANPKAKVKVLAETRGEGGFVVAAPSGGTVHPSGLSWEIVTGSPETVPAISWDERQCLHAAIHAALDEMPQVQPVQRETALPRPSVPQGDGVRPGDDFNDRADWSDPDLLGGAGWTVSHQQGNTTYWVKPGANPRDGHHATTGRDGSGANDRLYVFSTSTEFPTEEPLSKFAVYAILNHNGDFKAATKALSADGYGDDPRPLRSAPLTPDWSQGDDFWDMATDQQVRDKFDELPKAQVVTDPDEWYDIDTNMSLSVQARESYTDTGMANRFLREHAERFLYVRPDGAKRGTGYFRFYNGVVWTKHNADRNIDSAIEFLLNQLEDEAKAELDGDEKSVMGKALERYVRSARSNSGFTSLRNQIANKLAVSPDLFDRRLDLVGLGNGVLDVKRVKVIRSRPDFYLTRQMAVRYDPKATAPAAEKFMSQVIPDDEYRDFVERGIGYTLTGEQDQRAFFIVHGDKGTGKSQFLELFNMIFGDYAAAAADGAFQKRSGGAGGPMAELHALRDSRFIFASENDKNVVFNADLIKRICGGDTQSTRTLFEGEMANWRAKGVVWLAANGFPRFPADDDAIWDRVKPIPFDQHFPQQSGRVTAMATKIFESEASGLLNLMIDWLRRYREVGLVQPKAVTAGAAEQQAEGNPVAQWFEENRELGEFVESTERSEWMTGDVAFGHFMHWYKLNFGRNFFESRTFFTLLRKHLKYEKLDKSNSIRRVPGWRSIGTRGVLGSMGHWR